MRRFSIRNATLSDIAPLLRLEDSSFRTDRISRRSFRRLIRSPSAICRVARAGNHVAGYAVVLSRAGSTVARLYSLAVDADFRGLGLAAALVEDAERVAARRGMTRLRLEVREDNAAAIRLYERLAFRQCDNRPGYYADGATAIRYQKRLERRRSPGGARPLRSDHRQG